MASLPAQFRRVIAHTLSADFRAATKIVSVDMADTVAGLEPKQVLVRNIWAGVNASDINYTAGRYLPGVPPPLYPGFEAVGEVVKVGTDVKDVSVGSPVAITGYGCFSEYQVVPAKTLIPIPSPDPAFIPLMVSGLTASIALEQVGDLKSGEVVMVTAAAGSTGQFAVQLAKKAGNTVIGTCSTDEKVRYLKSIGCDRVINYKTEDVRQVLRTEFPKGVDLVYESVGGAMYDTCVDALAVGGRLVVIGFISGYKDQSGWTKAGQASKQAAAQEQDESKSGDGKKPKGPSGKGAPLPVKLLAKSASVRGFFLNNFAAHWAPHMQKLGGMVMAGELTNGLDPNAKFVGLEQCADAIDYMYAGKNVGKVVVKVDAGASGARSRL